MGTPSLFPTSVVGSLPRPEWLIEAIANFERRRLPRDRLETFYDDAVKLVIKEQESTGVDEISDGEQRRFSFLAFVAERLPSFRLTPVKQLMNPEASKYARQMNLPIDIISNPVIVDKVKRTAPLAVGELEFAKRYTSKPVKVPIIGPFTLLINSWNRKKSGQVYRDPEDCFPDLTTTLREEIIALKAAGASFVQLDEPAIGNFVDYRYTRWLLSLNQWKLGDVEELHAIASELINRTVRGVVGVKLGVHICRGNWPADEAHLSHGGYESMINEILEMKVDQLVLEYATKRAGGFEVFEKHPWHGEIGLGVIDVKNPRVEEPEEIVQRVERALKIFDMEKITMVPDCGFSSGRPWPVVTRQIALRKLQAETEAAKALRKKYS